MTFVPFPVHGPFWFVVFDSSKINKIVFTRYFARNNKFIQNFVFFAGLLVNNKMNMNKFQIKLIKKEKRYKN